MPKKQNADQAEGQKKVRRTKIFLLFAVPRTRPQRELQHTRSMIQRTNTNHFHFVAYFQGGKGAKEGAAADAGNKKDGKKKGKK